MITAKDVREEIKIARTVFDNKEATNADKLKVLLKLVEVGIKINLGNRVNLVRIMEHLKVEKVQPRKPRENAEEPKTE